MSAAPGMVNATLRRPTYTAPELADKLRGIAAAIRDRHAGGVLVLDAGSPGPAEDPEGYRAAVERAAARRDAELEDAALLERTAGIVEELAAALRDVTGYTPDDYSADAAWDRAVDLVAVLVPR